MRLELNGLTAHICCDGKELEVYGVHRDNERTVSGWIASETGKTFTVHWGDESSMTFQIRVVIDGRLMAQTAHEEKLSGSVKGVEEKPGQRRPFKFAPLVLTDDESVASSLGRVDENLGTIELSMRKVAYFSEGTNFYSVGSICEISAVHERSKKAGVHAVSLGEVQTTKPHKGCHPHGLQSEPFAVFKFRYRPLELLRANDIAPPPPTNLVNERKRPLDTDDVPEAGPSRQKPRLALTQEIPKSEDDDDDDYDRVNFLQEQIVLLQKRLAEEQAKKRSKAIKRELSPIVIPSGDDGTIIDLTEDL